VQFHPEQRRALLGIAYLCSIVTGVALAYLGAAWALGALGYTLPTLLPDDAFEPVLFFLGLMFAASSWTIAQLRRDNTALSREQPAAPASIDPDVREQLLASQLQRLTNRLQDTLAEQARIELGLTSNPASVAPRWRQHLGMEHADPQPLDLTPPDEPPTFTTEQQTQAASLQRQMSELEENLHLIRERKAEFPEQEAIPLMLIKNEREQEALLADLREQFGRVTTPTAVPTREAAITRAFDRFNGQLLILGAPGAGKTTLLLELARDLTARAQADAAHPIPVFVNLSTWGSKPRPLDEWLIEALQDAVGTSKQFAWQLIAGDHLLLLLDGLDEVAAEHRAGCVRAINTFLTRLKQQKAAVCCRVQEYEEIGEQLAFESALRVEPLTTQQIRAVLNAGGRAMAGVVQALEHDQQLRELLTTPLLLNIIILAYSGQNVPKDESQSLDERRRHLFAAYVKRMLTRYKNRLGEKYLPKAQDWLAWLAHQMSIENTTDFRIGHMKPTMLADWWPYQVLFGLGGGLAVGLVIGMAVGLDFGLVVGLAAGLIGLAFGLFIAHGSWRVVRMFCTTISPTEALRWSWQGIHQLLRSFLPKGLGIWLFSGLFFALFGALAVGLPVGVALVRGLVVGLFFGMFMMFGGVLFVPIAGFQPVDVVTTSAPNQAIRRSLLNGFIVWVAGGLISGVLAGLFFVLLLVPFLILGTELVVEPVSVLLTVLPAALGFGFISSLLGALAYGWGAAIQHYFLRLLLWREGVIPLNYIHFLCLCDDALLLQRDGAIFRFRHPLLQNYFADLYSSIDTPQAATNYTRVAEVHYDRGDYNAARPLYERALAIREQELGPEHPDIATNLHDLGRLYYAEGDYQLARIHYERALTSREQELGPEHPDIATSLNDLAELLDIQGDYDAARPLYERALAIREQVLEEKHLDIAISLTNLARLLETQGDYDVARPLYERALYIRKKALRKRHPDIATSLINLARLLEAQNADKAARRLYQQVLTIHKESLGSKHADIVYSRERLAAINAEMRKRGHPWWKFW
jgi:tetratricopeptide (TPR) repeat protein/GTPase SAR1 family protein